MTQNLLELESHFSSRELAQYAEKIDEEDLRSRTILDSLVAGSH